jgi:hypothetical protein
VSATSPSFSIGRSRMGRRNDYRDKPRRANARVWSAICSSSCEARTRGRQKRRGVIVAPVLKDDTGPVEPTANRGAHLSIVFSDTAGKDDEVHSAEHGRVRHCACP